jgi:septal ring factor EnvC (AmiA/AmiB activator)
MQTRITAIVPLLFLFADSAVAACNQPDARAKAACIAQEKQQQPDAAKHAQFQKQVQQLEQQEETERKKFAQQQDQIERQIYELKQQMSRLNDQRQQLQHQHKVDREKLEEQMARK